MQQTAACGPEVLEMQRSSLRVAELRREQRVHRSAENAALDLEPAELDVLRTAVPLLTRLAAG